MLAFLSRPRVNDVAMMLTAFAIGFVVTAIGAAA
ncbi:hypothetical protein SAMN05216176_101442 [Nitratireductor indicus]|nr:hypothetical protein SAMN05216176_101442 [Nitratireductor indicus]